MTCAAVREAVLDLARGVAMPESLRLATERHVNTCQACAADLDRQRDLTAALQGLSAEAQRWEASPQIEPRLLAAFEARHAPGMARSEPDRPRDRWVYALAAAAVVALAVWIGSRAPRQPPATLARNAVSAPVPPAPAAPSPAAVAAPQPPRPTPIVKPRPARRAAVPQQPVRSVEFIALPTAVGLPDLESGSVVRIQVPVAALPGYGMDIVPNGQKTTVEADVLVGQDGQPRAIRLVTAEETSSRDVRSRP